MVKSDKKNIQEIFADVSESVVDSPYKGVVIESGIEGTPAEAKAFRSEPENRGYRNDKRVKQRVK